MFSPASTFFPLKIIVFFCISHDRSWSSCVPRGKKSANTHEEKDGADPDHKQIPSPTARQANRNFPKATMHHILYIYNIYVIYLYYSTLILRTHSGLNTQ